MHTTSRLAPSPLQALHSPLLKQTGIQLSIKRDDLIHTEFGGNKWRKLKYNLQYARNHQYTTLLTFGGAWSNHIYATAAAGKHFGFKTIGIIRGEKHQPLNPTLQFAEKSGMQLVYIDREQYRHKTDKHFIDALQKQYGRFYLIPEGGSNLLALEGCKEIVQEIHEQKAISNLADFDNITCACGTGATLAGLISGLAPGQQATGFSVLKGEDRLTSAVENLLKEKHINHKNWQIQTDYHLGGYAKVNHTLRKFKQDFEEQYKIQLDYVYTAKMFCGLFDLINKGYFKSGTRIIALHTGGLQGNAGFSQENMRQITAMSS